MQLLTLFVLTILCIFCSASPLDPNRHRVQKPFHPAIYSQGLEPDEESPGGRLSDLETPGIKGYPHVTKSKPRHLRKGEYYCGDSICKLKPGEKPEGCGGVCQYMTGPDPPHSAIDFDDDN